MNIKNIKQKLRKLTYTLLALPLIGGAGASLMTSCSEWKDHFEGGGADGTDISVWEQIMNTPELSDFAEVMQAISITRQHKKTTTPYSEFLSGGRALTIFAPVNGSFDKAALLDLVQTNSGDSAVEKYFAQNHLISSPHSIVGDGGNEKLMLMNKKYATFMDNAVNGIAIVNRNIRCNNGILHIIKEPLPYSYTIFEALTNQDEFVESGKILKSYNIQEFNEEASVSSGTVDGVKIFVDSVTYDRNKMLEAVGAINDNDSSYIAVVPNKAAWETTWNKVSAAFVYPNAIDKRDSLQTYYTYRAIMDDAIYSMTTVNKNQRDSVISKFYTHSRPEYHVFHKPYEVDPDVPGSGVLANPEKIVDCCNGKIYVTNNWPYLATQTYHKKLEIEAEAYEMLKTPNLDPKATLPKVGISESSDLRVSKGGYADINASANWTVTYKVQNSLSAKYDVKLVILPLSIVDKTTIARPNKFKVTINYLDLDGKQQTYSTNVDYFNKELEVDTVTVAENLMLPVCNYDMDNNNVSITISANVGARETGKYSRRMLLDAILFTPKED